ncbi:MAG: hypothetical protein ACR2M4_03195 [Actinomycetota bacterium]
MAVRSIKINDAQLAKITKDPNGPIGRYVGGLAGKITREAKIVASQRVKSRTGRYHGSFRTTGVAQTGGGFRVKSYNDARHAAVLERGAPPHIIRGNPLLAFVWENAPATVRIGKDGKVRFKSVNHPGFKARRVLEVAARRVVSRER